MGTGLQNTPSVQGHKFHPAHHSVCRRRLPQRLLRSLCSVSAHCGCLSGCCLVACPALQGAAGVDDEDEAGLTPLHTAAELGAANLAELLLEKGADLNHAGGSLVPYVQSCHYWCRLSTFGSQQVPGSCPQVFGSGLQALGSALNHVTVTVCRTGADQLQSPDRMGVAVVCSVLTSLSGRRNSASCVSVCVKRACMRGHASWCSIRSCQDSETNACVFVYGCRCAPPHHCPACCQLPQPRGHGAAAAGQRHQGGWGCGISSALDRIGRNFCRQ